MHSYFGSFDCTFLSFTASKMSTLLPLAPKMISFFAADETSIIKP